MLPLDSLSMLPLETLFCPCCTPALLHSLAQSHQAMMSRQMLLLGTGALTAALTETVLKPMNKPDVPEVC
jgi:hypothetical protein